jgi:hypothetical protein
MGHIDVASARGGAMMREIINEIHEFGSRLELLNSLDGVRWSFPDSDDKTTYVTDDCENVGWNDGDGTGCICTLYHHKPTGRYILAVDPCTLNDDDCRYGVLTAEQAEEAIEACAATDEFYKQQEKEMDEKEAYENETWPNIARVRDRIAKLKTPEARGEALSCLSFLMSRDLHEHICGWPLPTFNQIERMDSDALKRLMSNRMLREAVR